MKNLIWNIIINLSRKTGLSPFLVSMIILWIQFGIWLFITEKNQINPEFTMMHFYILIGETFIGGIFLWVVMPDWAKKKPSEW